MPRLVLSRKTKQGVTIHRDGEVLANLEVHKVDRNAVTLAFVADADIKIDRDEIYSKTKDTDTSEY
jgi:carbon storage regulator CsrA